MSGFSGCESCSHFVWNEDLEEYESLDEKDEDEYASLIYDHSAV